MSRPNNKFGKIHVKPQSITSLSIVTHDGPNTNVCEGKEKERHITVSAASSLSADIARQTVGDW